MVSLFEWGRVRKRDTDYGTRRSAPNAIAAIHKFKMIACISFENASYKRFFPIIFLFHVKDCCEMRLSGS